MKLIYIANARMPSERAHSFQIAKMCEAFTKAGREVELIVPARWLNPYGSKDIYKFYNIKNKFLIKKILVLDFLFLPFFKKCFFYLEATTFAYGVKKYLKKQKFDVIFSRDQFSAKLLTDHNFKVCYEIHDMPTIDARNRAFLHNVWKIVVTNTYKKDKIIKEFGIIKDKILVAQNAVDLKEFETNKSKIELRQDLGLPKDVKIIMYLGKFASWKGLDTLINAAEAVITRNKGVLTGHHRNANSRGYIHTDYSQEKIIFCFVGVTPKSVSENSPSHNFELLMRDVFGDKYDDIVKDIIFIPHQEHYKVPAFLKSADVLVIPNTDKFSISKEETSPIKLFEYMASGTPILASDIPSIREIVGRGEEGERLVNFFAPDDPVSLVEKTLEILKNSDKIQEISRRAYQKIQNLTWDNRTKNILDFLKI